MSEGEIRGQTIGHPGQMRFRELLQGAGDKRALYDQALVEVHGCVVAPTLGSIVPNWLLVVPRRRVLNFREWRTITGVDPVGLLCEILAELNVAAERAIWFEHGPSSAGSPVGCGLDYAHLHMLVDAPFSFEQFLESAVDNTRLRWRCSSAHGLYDSIPAGRPYLVAGRLNKSVIFEDVETIGSQFFRRVIAQLAGKPQQWDYRTHKHMENVHQTATFFGHRGTLAAAS